MKESTGMDFPSSNGAVEVSTMWKGIVVKSFMVLQPQGYGID